MEQSDFGSPGSGGYAPTTFVVDGIVVGDKGYARGPERALLSALLFDGLQAYVNYVITDSARTKSRYREAYNWLTTLGSDYVFSFENVCEALGIDPEFLRYGLMNTCNSRLEEWGRSRRNF